MRHAFRYHGVPFLTGALTAFFVIMVTYSLDRLERDRQQQASRLDALDTLNDARARLETALNARIYICEGLAAAAANPRFILNNNAFHANTRELIRIYPEILCALITRNGAITHVSPESYQKIFTERDLKMITRAARSIDFELNTAAKSSVVSGPTRLANGVMALIILFPVKLMNSSNDADASSWDVASLLLNFQDILREADMRQNANGLQFALREYNGDPSRNQCFWGNPDVFTSHPIAISINFPNNAWQLAAVPVGGWKTPEMSWFAWMAGIAMAFTAGGFVWLAIRYPQVLRRAIKERAKIENALRESELMYRILYDTAQVGLYRCSLDGSKFLLANKVMARVFGYDSVEDFLRERAPDNIYWAPEGREKLLSALRRDNQVQDMEIEAKRRNGEKLFLSVNAAIHPGEDIIEGAVLDITERKSSEQLREDIERIIRHDIRAPLTGIVSVPDILLMSDNLTQDQVELIKGIRDSSHRMTRLLNLSLDIYKMERGVYELMPDRFNLLPCLESVIRESSIDKPETPIVVTVDGEPAGDMKIFYVIGEELLIYSMLANLVKNALQATGEDDNAEVTIACHSEKKRDIIEIHNQGVVPPHMRKTFFDKYSTYGKRGGTGLGTYSARLIAKTHGGNITMLSEEGQGTTVTISLPNSLPSF